MGTGGDGAAARHDRAAVLASLRAAADGHGPRTCRWPPCGRDAAPVGARGPDGGAAPASGGRRPEFCSEAHQRASRRAVRDLAALLADARALRAASPVREHKAVDAVVADLEHRVALHGEPVPPPAPPPPVGPGLAAVAHLRPADPLDRPEPQGPPALALRPGVDPGRFEEDWEFFRDAADGARPLLDRLRRASGDDERQRITGEAWHNAVDLVRAADQLLAGVVRVRAPRPGRRR